MKFYCDSLVVQKKKRKINVDCCDNGTGIWKIVFQTQAVS